MISQLIKDDLVSFSSPDKALILQRFFKTGEGEYAEGDIFAGCTVPEVRAVAKKFCKQINLSDIEQLLKYSIHECRLCGLILLTHLFNRSGEADKKEIVDFYLQHTDAVNNWDLVDISSYNILGNWLIDKKDRSILYKLADSENLWEQRIAMVSTMALVKNRDFGDAMSLAEHFLTHKHDLMHKAAGWLLREVGKKNDEILLSFLDIHYKKMPRTMLRYAIEKLPQNEKAYYMKK